MRIRCTPPRSATTSQTECPAAGTADGALFDSARFRHVPVTRGRRACLDEGCQRGERGECVEVDVLGGDIDAIPVSDLAQQQRAGQRVKADAGAEQRRIGGRLSQLRAAGDVGEDLAQLVEDQGAPPVRRRRSPWGEFAWAACSASAGSAWTESAWPAWSASAGSAWTESAWPAWSASAVSAWTESAGSVSQPGGSGSGCASDLR